MQRRVNQNSAYGTENDTNDKEDLKKSKKNDKSQMWSGIFIVFKILTIIISPVIYLLLTRLGVGRKFPSQSQFKESKPLLDESVLEIIAELSTPPGNLAVSSDGRIFFNFHPEYESSTKIAELFDVKEYAAFPSVAFQKEITTCLSLRIDNKNNLLWLLDYAQHGFKGHPKLIAIDIDNHHDKVVKTYSFPSEVAGMGSMLNDFQIDPSGDYIYLADTSIVGTTPSLIVYSVNTGLSHRILSGHSSMLGRSTFLDISGHHSVGFGPFGLKINVDSIALDRTGSVLYYGGLTSNSLFAISTSHLLFYVNKIQSSPELAETLRNNMGDYVQQVSSLKPATDGLSSDRSGNLYMTAIEHSAIAIALPVLPVSNKKSHPDEVSEAMQIVKLIQSETLLRWPDGLSFGTDGLYITNSALHLKFTGANMTQNGPYHILRIPRHVLEGAVKNRGKEMVWPVSGQ